MMRSTFGSLEIAKRSLFTHQASLQTTGHNLANANTVGYSRQVVNHVAAEPLEAIGMNRSTIPDRSVKASNSITSSGYAIAS